MSISKKYFSGAAVLFTCASSITLAASNYKQIAVPPSDINQQALSKAINDGISSHSTMLPIYNDITRSQSSVPSALNSLQKTQNNEWTQSIYVDSNENFPLLFISPDAEQWEITLTDPEGNIKHDDRALGAKAISPSNITMGDKQFLGKRLSVSSTTAGQWKVQLRSKAPLNNLQTKGITASTDNTVTPEGYLMFKGDSRYKLYSHLDNKFTIVNSNVNVVAYLVNTSNSELSRSETAALSPMASSVDIATVNVTLPDDSQVSLKMNDSGINRDAVAGDGRYTAQLPTHTQGVYTYQIQVEGTRPDGLRYSRTTTNLYPIEQQSYRFDSNNAQLTTADNYRAEFSIALQRNQDSDEEVFAAGEVWGTNSQGEMQAAAWIGGVVIPQNQDKQISNINLGFDLRWLSLAELNAPFELRNVRLQTLETNTPIAQKKRIGVSNNASLATKQTKQLANLQHGIQDNQEITPEMLMGKPPEQAQLISTKQQGINATAAAQGPLMLVHGYCSSGKTWDTRDFTNAVVFKDFNQNRSHDAFARKIRDAAASYSSFGVVAHSQGGAASLQLLAKYWTGLDVATGGRKIQSVGTPYQGTALAGNLAVLGEVFGIGCGKNTDLTYDGASNWLSTIPNWAKAEVDYYTTSFKDRVLAYDYCQIASDVLLDDPDDGTTEKWAGKLPGGVNKGHKEGWCHTESMRDPSQTRDRNRNSSMNNRAAR